MQTVRFPYIEIGIFLFSPGDKFLKPDFTIK